MFITSFLILYAFNGKADWPIQIILAVSNFFISGFYTGTRKCKA